MNSLANNDNRPERNYFDLFALTPAFAVDLPLLDRAYRDFQGRVHPDKFVRGTSTEQRQAAQWASVANEAYQTLKHPLPRARHLVQLHNVNPDACTVPGSFLMAQMEFREAVQAARRTKNSDALFEINVALQRERKALLAKLAQQLDTEHDFPSAAQSAQMLQYSLKLAADIDDAMEILEA